MASSLAVPGRSQHLSNEEKKQLYFSAREYLPKGFPIIVNVAEQTTAAATALAADAEAWGADALMLLPPMRYYADNAETLAFFKAVAAATSLPIMLYNNPVDYKIFITLEMFEALAPFKNIQAVKESSRDVMNITRMINRFGDRYKILTGVDPSPSKASCSARAAGWQGSWTPSQGNGRYLPPR